MQLLNFATADGAHLGIAHAGAILDVSREAARRGGEFAPLAGWTCVDDALSAPGGLEQLERLVEAIGDGDAALVEEGSLRRLPPVIHPPRIFALGRNFPEHAKEGGGEVPPYPMIFFKPSTCLVGDGATIEIPPSTDKVDWEVEIAVVIGSGGKHIPRESALSAVAGYCTANDVSARDWQRRTSQFDQGKMFDGFLPLGPALVTPDESGDPGSLMMKTWVNDTLMQDGNSKDMVFDVPMVVSYLSDATRLLPGDVILMGTPSGVGFARTPPIFIHGGDVVRVWVENLGSLTNAFIDA
jgi:2-keto-4-pentenoate hydratase/2-oxohepta-3-ene-1,7-dioic acid hydratase in catechol pathway